MPRKRMIDPGIWQSQDFGNLSTLAKLVFIGLFSQADDDGRGRAKPQYVRNILFPYDEVIEREDVVNALREIEKFMSITFYVHGGNEYYSLTKWRTWQKVEKCQQSNLPEPPDHSPNVPRTIAPNRIEQNKNRIEKNNICPSAPSCVGENETPSAQQPTGKNRYTPPFEEFWSAYPRKDDKGQAYKKYIARMNDGYTEEELLAAAKDYSAQCKSDRTKRKYIKQGKTFLGDATPFIDFLPKRYLTAAQERADPFDEAEKAWADARMEGDTDGREGK